MIMTGFSQGPLHFNEMTSKNSFSPASITRRNRIGIMHFLIYQYSVWGYAALTWPLATLLYVEIQSDLTAKCLNNDWRICSKFIFESLRKLWEGEGRLMGFIIGASCAEMVLGLESITLLIKMWNMKHFIGGIFFPHYSDNFLDWQEDSIQYKLSL